MWNGGWLRGSGVSEEDVQKQTVAVAEGTFGRMGSTIERKASKNILWGLMTSKSADE